MALSITTSKHIKVIHVFAMLALCAVMGVLLVHKIENFDIWLHLTAGRHIIQTGVIPHTEIFSYPLAGHAWIDHEWLAQIIYYGIFSVSGPSGLIILNMLLLAAGFFTLFAVGTRRMLFFLKWLVIICALFVARLRFPVRPESFSLFFFSMYLVVISRYRTSKNNKIIYIIPALQLLWVNMHGYFFFGLVLLWVYIIAEWVQNKMHILEWDARNALKGNKLKHLFVAGVLAVLASAITPYGKDGFLYPFQAMAEMSRWGDFYKSFVTELHPLFTVLLGTSAERSDIGIFFYVLLAISIMSFILNVRRMHLADFILYTVIFYLTVAMIRHLELFALGAAYFTIVNGVSFAEMRAGYGGGQWISERMIHVYKVMFSILIAALFFMVSRMVFIEFFRNNSRPPRIGFGCVEGLYPDGAISFMEEHELSGNFYNTPSSGGYILWKTFPKRKIFIDMRTEVYGRDFYQATMILSPPVWNRLCARYTIDFVVLRHSMGGSLFLARMLARDVGWKPVYFDPVSIIFVRDMLKFSELIQQYEIDLNSPSVARSLWGQSAVDGRGHSFSHVYPWQAINLGVCYMELGFLDRAVEAYRYALQFAPDSATVHNNLGVTLLQQRRFSEAYEHLEYAHQLRPSQLSIERNIATLRIQQERAQQRRREISDQIARDPALGDDRVRQCALYCEAELFDDALRIGKALIAAEPSAAAYHLVGLAALYTNDLTSARAMLEKARVLAPYEPTLLLDLAGVYGECGDFDRSRECLGLIPEESPFFNDARYNLGITYANSGSLEQAIDIWRELLQHDPSYQSAADEIEKAQEIIKEIERLPAFNQKNSSLHTGENI